VTEFRPGSVDYERQAPNFTRGRALTPDAEASWREAVQRWLLPLGPALVLDLGSGSGRFSPLLAEWLSCSVIGVEPSDGMRAAATREHPHPRVEYKAGDANSIPMADGSCGAAWLGYMVHHVPDRVGCARELVRVVRPGGLILVVGAYTADRSRFNLFKYFPAALKIAEGIVKAPRISADFEGGGLEPISAESILNESCRSLKEAAGRTALRADTTLQLITDEEFAAGQRSIEEAAARETEPRPIIDPIGLLVYRRP
jgi:ubiquinone/menaquinone biosynthesis C-methylase UbiE